MKQMRPLRYVAIVIAMLSACTLATVLASIFYLGQRGAHPSPSPSDRLGIGSDEFPEVDWAYWKQVNPDLIGWITVPGTAVDLPIVQASEQDPDFYLTHDVYGEANFTGCPYLDADCGSEGGLLRCPNSVVYGHNMGWSSDMFGDLTRYMDEAWGEEHRYVLVQTPSVRMRLEVQALAVLPGWDAVKRVRFTGVADFTAWWNARFEECDLLYAPTPRTERNLLTLCTCSYSHWNNERTLVYCMAA